MSELCFIDCETTGLDPRIHQPYEVCWWHEEDDLPVTSWLRHDLVHADPKALEIGRYWERRAHGAHDGGHLQVASPRVVAASLQGVTLVGANPAFDAAMLTRYIGAPVWHYRLIDVETLAMGIFGWDRPLGLSAVADECRDAYGFTIPTPDHTATGDVRTTRAVYQALRAIRENLQ